MLMNEIFGGLQGGGEHVVNAAGITGLITLLMIHIHKCRPNTIVILRLGRNIVYDFGFGGDPFGVGGGGIELGNSGDGKST